jgi:hypothetical protein
VGQIILFIILSSNVLQNRGNLGRNGEACFSP